MLAGLVLKSLSDEQHQHPLGLERIFWLVLLVERPPDEVVRAGRDAGGGRP